MIKYFDKGVRVSDSEIGNLVMTYGTVVLDDFDKVEYSDCCEANVVNRTHYKRLIKICSKCKNDVDK